MVPSAFADRGRSTRPSLLWLCAFCLVYLALAASAHGARIALVVGNANYKNDELSLLNPGNDAAALEKALTDLGFSVTKLTNQSKREMEAALSAFSSALTNAEIGLFFYAGHGLQAEGDNFLLGSDFVELNAAELTEEAVALSDVRAIFKRSNPGLGVVILDACRNNPLVDGVPSVIVVDGEGLGRSSGGSGMLIAYATDPGAVAYDGKDENSVFTSALLRHIATPGLDVRLMFGRVRQEVVVATGGRQVPWVEESVLGEYQLNNVLKPLEPPVDLDIESWRLASQSDNNDAYRTYLEKFPEGLFSEFARGRLQRVSLDRQQEHPVAPDNFDQWLNEGAAPRIAAALELMGYLSAVKGKPQNNAELQRGLRTYRGQLPEDQDFDRGLFFSEAARLSVLFGTTLSQRLRTDLVALKSIERTLEIAQEAFHEVEFLATNGNREAVAAQVELREDLRAIELARRKVLDRLDQSREYYADLLEISGQHFESYLSQSLFGLSADSRSLHLTGKHAEVDMRRFIAHVRKARAEKTRGTLAWLTDFLPAR